MRLIATSDLWYGGTSYFAGQEFDAGDRDAKILKLMKKAADAPKHYRASAQFEYTAEPDQPRRRRKYRRRDMAANIDE